MSESIQDYHKQGYAWVSFALALPVFLWPSFLALGFTPAFGINIEQNWLVAACSLLMAVVVADSILSYRHHISHMIGSAVWVIVVSSMISLAIRNPHMAWFIAILFALRPLHLFHSLWLATSESHQWWHWIAWWRDSSTAVVMFLWLSYWPQ